MNQNHISSPSISPSTIASKQPRFIVTEPSAGRIVDAIAGFPYSLGKAVLDICDNSIMAGASLIHICIKNAKHSKKKVSAVEGDALVIIDNGTGIPPEILNEVLRAGSKTSDRYVESSLSRYGAGLKGAGFYAGDEIILLTKYPGQPLRRRSINLKVIKESDRWLQESRDPNKEETEYFESAMRDLNRLGGHENENIESGTIIIIRDLNIRSKNRTNQVKQIPRLAGQTYSKLMSAGNGKLATFRLFVDDKEVKAIDPLHRHDERTMNFYRNEEIRLDDGSCLYFSAVSLPHQSQVDPDLKREYRYSQADQGIYVFRNNRLIVGAETLGLFGKDNHLNAFRAELTYNSSADHHVVPDVAKSAVTLSQDLENKLKSLVSDCTRTADTLWREKAVLTEQDIRDLFDESNRLIASRFSLLVSRFDTKSGKVIKASRKITPDTKTEVEVETKTEVLERKTPSSEPTKKPKAKEIRYLRPVDQLPDGMLYRPILDGNTGSIVVEVNLSHPFSKAVFSVSQEEGKQKVLRRATTAIQQLLYIFGAAEYSFDESNAELFEQFRRYTSVNLNALLND